MKRRDHNIMMHDHNNMMMNSSSHRGRKANLTLCVISIILIIISNQTGPLKNSRGQGGGEGNYSLR